MDDDVLLLDVADRVALVTLHRPDARNALSRRLLAELTRTMEELDRRDDVDVIVLTGADPAFCAGLDLREVGADGGALTTAGGGDAAGSAGTADPDRFLAHTKPLIGAVNGVAVTGGLELALRCDWLVASDRARFADTHTRVGVQPLWGLTVLLPEAVGLRRARQMSATGEFVDAPTALAWGLVNRVVPHDELLPFTLAMAAEVAANDAEALVTLLDTYRRGSQLPAGEALRLEGEVGREWLRRRFDPAEVEQRRAGVVARGRERTGN